MESKTDRFKEQPYKIALLAGATGLVGSNLVNELCKNNTYKHIYVLTRRSVSYTDRRVQVLKINYEDCLNSKIQTPGYSAHHYYCCLGGRAIRKSTLLQVDYKYVLHLAKVAEKDVLCTQFICLSSIGANLRLPFFYTYVKGKTEHALRLLSIEGLHVLRPSGILGSRLDPRITDLGILFLYKIVNMFLGRTKAYFIAMPATYVAKAMYRIAIKERKGHHIYGVKQIVSLAFK